MKFTAEHAEAAEMKGINKITNLKSKMSNKHQWPKFQIPNSYRLLFGAFGNWVLRFVWDFGFVIWDFERCSAYSAVSAVRLRRI
jgi:hypothetical protein